MTILNIGRLGDLINLAPVLYHEHQQCRTPTIVVGQDFESLLDGITYAKKRVWSLGCETLPLAETYCNELPDLRVAQVFQNKDKRRLTPSFAQESYRLGGFLDEWGKHPTVFDNRDKAREAALVKKLSDGRPMILVAATGISSQFSRGTELVAHLSAEFPDMQVVDIGAVRVERFYDLLGLMDAAKVLVTIDTAHIWLARASTCPVIALVNDSEDGWWGSPPPPNAVDVMGYSQVNFHRISGGIMNIMEPHGRVITVIDEFGSGSRQKKAKASWKGMRDMAFGRQERGSKEIGDDRDLPFLKDMLQRAILFSATNDIIIWTNDDVQIISLKPILERAMVFGACCTRREAGHIGRELFAFRAGWIASHLDSMPDVILAAPWFDLAITAWLRSLVGIVSTMENLHDDRFPVEVPPGCVYHPEHKSSWTLADKSAAWNENLAKGFFQCA